ncbi:MAG: glycosyltransferase family 2 protein [Bacteroidetes bacterium]|nr:glycosyltransferase family 2 protein [Bacteroidota bacterium]
MKPLISIVSPVYGGEKTTAELVSRLHAALQPLTANYEIILVEDHSPDNSWAAIEATCAQDPRVVGIKLSRNYGQHYAITAGLDHAQGEWVVVMDCDLQDRPEEIPALYRAVLDQNLDYVQAVRSARQDNARKRLGSFLFYRVLSHMVGKLYDHRKANFGIYHHKVIKAIASYRERNRFFPALVQMVGFTGGEVEVTHAESGRGGSTYNLRKLLRLAEDIILSHSDKPLRYITRFGFFISFLSLLGAAITFVRWTLGYIEVLGYASIILSVLFSTGILMFTLGILGLYVGKTFDAVKNRPLYIIDQHLGQAPAAE